MRNFMDIDMTCRRYLEWRQLLEKDVKKFHCSVFKFVSSRICCSVCCLPIWHRRRSPTLVAVNISYSCLYLFLATSSYRKSGKPWISHIAVYVPSTGSQPAGPANFALEVVILPSPLQHIVARVSNIFLGFLTLPWNLFVVVAYCVGVVHSRNF